MIATGEFRKWKEYRRTIPDVDWRNAAIVSCGIDVGSVSSKAVIMADGKLYAYSLCRTGSTSKGSSRQALDWALQDTGLSEDRINYTVGTGYGRLHVPMAQRTITEIACHARGAVYIYGPTVRTVLDVGGQDIKVIKCDEKGKVLTFVMNDKCAAGTGRGMEAMAELLAIPIEELGKRSLEVETEPEPVASTCVVYAKTEALSLLRRGVPVNAVLAAYCRAMALRIKELIDNLGPIEERFVLTGGQSKNIGLVRRLRDLLKVEPLESGDLDAQLAGGIGAALFAKAFAEKSKAAK